MFVLKFNNILSDSINKSEVIQFDISTKQNSNNNHLQVILTNKIIVKPQNNETIVQTT